MLVIFRDLRSSQKSLSNFTGQSHSNFLGGPEPLDMNSISWLHGSGASTSWHQGLCCKHQNSHLEICMCVVLSVENASRGVEHLMQDTTSWPNLVQPWDPLCVLVCFTGWIASSGFFLSCIVADSSMKALHLRTLRLDISDSSTNLFLLQAKLKGDT